jgi:hypothetical protein
VLYQLSYTRLRIGKGVRLRRTPFPHWIISVLTLADERHHYLMISVT